MKTKLFLFKKVSLFLIITLPLFFLTNKVYSTALTDEYTVGISDTGGEQWLKLDPTECCSCGACIEKYPDKLAWDNEKPRFKGSVTVTDSQAKDLIDLCPTHCFSKI